MQWLAELCVKRPIFATVLMLVVLVLGLGGYGRLGVDRFPKIDLPMVAITTRLPGAAPEDVETEITDKIEEAVNTVSGIEDLRSTSTEGVSQVFVQFVLEKNVDVGAQDVRDRLATIMADLPKGIDPPIVSKIDPDVAPVAATCASMACCAFHCRSEFRESCTLRPSVAGVDSSYPPVICCPPRPRSYTVLPGVPVSSSFSTDSMPCAPTPSPLTQPSTLPARLVFG